MYSLADIKNFLQNRKGDQPFLLVDTNLLLLLLVGSYEISLIRSSNCLSKFYPEDFDLLKKIIGLFQGRIIVTPHILAEFSNLSAGDLKEPKLKEYIQFAVENLKEYKESHVDFVTISNHATTAISKFGFSDIGIIELAKAQKIFILSDDFDLCGYANSLNIPNCNYTHIRTSEVLLKL